MGFQIHVTFIHIARCIYIDFCTHCKCFWRINHRLKFCLNKKKLFWFTIFKQGNLKIHKNEIFYSHVENHLFNGFLFLLEPGLTIWRKLQILPTVEKKTKKAQFSAQTFQYSCWRSRVRPTSGALWRFLPSAIYGTAFRRWSTALPTAGAIQSLFKMNMIFLILPPSSTFRAKILDFTMFYE